MRSVVNRLNVKRIDALLCAVAMAISFAVLSTRASAEQSPAPKSSAFTAEETQAIKERLSGLMGSAVLQGDAIARELSHRPVASLMISIIEDEQCDLNARISAMYVLSMAHDSKGIPVLRKIAESTLRADMSRDEVSLIRNAIVCLGPLADDETLDLLQEMTHEEYWIGRNPRATRSGQTPEQFRSGMVYTALSSFASSGSARAIRALETGEGLPEFLFEDKESSRVDRASYLRLAKMRSQGILRVSDDVPSD